MTERQAMHAPRGAAGTGNAAHADSARPPIEGTAEDDILLGRSGGVAIDGLGGDDLVFGGTGRDTLSGGEGNDLVEGGSGADLIYGDTAFGPFPEFAPPEPLGIGNLILAGSGADTVFAGFGEDTVFGGTGDDVITGAGAGAPGGTPGDIFDRLDGADLLLGGSGRDLIEGNGGDDTILGGAGADTLSGGYGVDLLDGDTGADVFVWRLLGRFQADPGTGVGEGERDVVRGFRPGEDRLDLGGLAIEPETDGTFLGTGAFTAQAGLQVRYDILEDGRTVVQFATGNGTTAPTAPRGEIELLGGHTLAATDFIL
ncbi:MAG TPA: calcium-binding protein [Acetobacteraceae bacterium]|jgi:Ca2+-binding RTX toxin-like protein|nr:calcium-binding protein [Acetobacteraceae bacterium]